jgi:hypothetical protein
MIVISARSPYQIIINETGQAGSKVELFIWNKGTTEPTIPTYIMSENIASVTQIETNYNISPYILEYINHIAPTYGTTPTEESNTNWCIVRVKRYKKDSVGAFTLLNNLVYLGVNGYTEVNQGLNFDIATNKDYCVLGYRGNQGKFQYFNNVPYTNILIRAVRFNEYRIRYYDSNSTLINTNVFLAPLTTGDYFNFRIPLAFNNSVYSVIESNTDDEIFNFTTEKLEECKYTPVNVSYVNKLGGWQQLTFFKAQTNSIAIKGSEYNLMQPNLNYNYQAGQKKSFNSNGKKTIKLNTGWVYEGYNKYIQELMLSDTVLVDANPAVVKTQSLTYKTDLKDKNINFEIDFEYSNNLLNDVV